MKWNAKERKGDCIFVFKFLWIDKYGRKRMKTTLFEKEKKGKEYINKLLWLISYCVNN